LYKRLCFPCLSFPTCNRLTVVASVVAVFSMEMPPRGVDNRKDPADKNPAVAVYTDPGDLLTLSG